MWYSPRSKARIGRSVRYTEQQRSNAPSVLPGGAGSRGRDPLLCSVSEDIEHNKAGKVHFLTGTSWFQMDDDTDRDELDVVNLLFPKLWKGSRVVIEPIYVHAVEDRQLVITQAYSATRIRGTAPTSGIATGATGTITSVIAIDGHFEPETAAVYLPTSNVAIGASLVTWAELVVKAEKDTFGDLTGNYESEWHAYASDCSGDA